MTESSGMKRTDSVLCVGECAELHSQCQTYKSHRVVTPRSYNTEPFHHRVLHQGLSVRLQGRDGDVLRMNTNTAQRAAHCICCRRFPLWDKKQTSYLDVVEVDLHQVGVVPFYSRQSFFDVGSVGLLIGHRFVLGGLDHT